MSNEYFRVVVKPLPAGSSWQDLKDFLRGCRSATPRYTDVSSLSYCFLCESVIAPELFFADT